MRVTDRSRWAPLRPLPQLLSALLVVLMQPATGERRFSVLRLDVERPEQLRFLSEVCNRRRWRESLGTFWQPCCARRFAATQLYTSRFLALGKRGR